MPTIIEQLEEISASLTEETWDTRKTGYYFVLGSNDKLCFCAHGAVQFVTDPVIKELHASNPNRTNLPTPLLKGEYSSGRMPSTLPASAAFYADKHCRGYHNKKTVWDNRPTWVRDNDLHGNQDVSFLLGMVGLTIDYNDHPSTRLSDIKEKFRQAIALARELNC